jgi:hypothetical protein
MQLCYQNRNPIVPDAAPVAKRLGPTNTELQGLCHPSTIRFSLSYGRTLDLTFTANRRRQRPDNAF